MAKKEHKGGELTNEQMEQELARTTTSGTEGGYKGIQDTGDSVKRELGTDVQRRDGLPADDEDQTTR
jgi:hypothetical protein